MAAQGRRGAGAGLQNRAELSLRFFRRTSANPVVRRPAHRRGANGDCFRMNRRRDANLRVGELIPIAKGSQIRGQSDGANRRARDGQPYEVDGDLLHASLS